VARSSPIQNAFNAGELSPQLAGRIDLEKYRNGCEVMENFTPQVFGPVRKRPGTRFVHEVKDSADFTRLIPFEFSTEQAYALEFGDEYIRFYTNGGIVESSPGTPYEIVSPYSSADLPLLSFAQSADVVYISHPGHHPNKLSRTGPTAWTITPVNFRSPAFDDRNTTSTTISFGAVTGNTTVTASSSIFVASDVGTYIQLQTDVANDYSPWIANASSYSAGNVVQHLGNVYEAQGSGTSGNLPPVHTEGTKSDGSINWTFLHDGQGYAQITGYTSGTSVSVTVISRVPHTSTSVKWAKGDWSPSRGYPRVVTFYEDRLWFGGSSRKPQTLWASTVSDYENFKRGTNDDDSLMYTINTQDLNTISWLAPGKVLAIGTYGGEFTIRANDINSPITPSSVMIQPQTTYGCVGNVRPLRIASSIIFVQRSARKLREYTYNFETDSYVAPNLTILSEHLAEAGIVDMTYQQEPTQIVWAARTDGVLLGMTYERAEDVVGWHRHNVGGAVESMISLPHWDGDQDVTWMIVRRTVNGQTKRYVEYLEKYLTGARSFFLDSGLTYSGAPTSTISGLGHLEGEEVAVLVDGSTHPNRVVQSGEIELNRPGSVVSVGLPYTAKIMTMPIEAGARDGVAQGKTQRIHNVTMRLFQTGAGLWYGDGVTMDELQMRSSNNDMDEALPLLTGDTPTLPWPGEYQKGAQVAVEHRLPLPCTIVALMPQMDTYDR